MERKKAYSTPTITLTRVELENSVCGGSATISNPDNENGRIVAQEVNEDFAIGEQDKTSTNINGWELTQE